MSTRDLRVLYAARVAEALLEDLTKLRQDERELANLDLIFLTGDIAYSGKPEEYRLALHFLTRLRRKMGVSKRRMFVIPGNHDVDRASISGRAQALSLQ